MLTQTLFSKGRQGSKNRKGHHPCKTAQSVPFLASEWSTWPNVVSSITTPQSATTRAWTAIVQISYVTCSMWGVFSHWVRERKRESKMLECCVDVQRMSHLVHPKKSSKCYLQYYCKITGYSSRFYQIPSSSIISIHSLQEPIIGMSITLDLISSQAFHDWMSYTSYITRCIYIEI